MAHHISPLQETARAFFMRIVLACLRAVFPGALRHAVAPCPSLSLLLSGLLQSPARHPRPAFAASLGYPAKASCKHLSPPQGPSSPLPMRPATFCAGTSALSPCSASIRLPLRDMALPPHTSSLRQNSVTKRHLFSRGSHASLQRATSPLPCVPAPPCRPPRASRTLSLYAAARTG